MESHSKQDKIQEALELLKEAACEKKGELCEMIGNHCCGIKEVLNRKTDDGREALRQARKQIIKNLQEKEEEFWNTTKSLERKIQKNPWKYAGAVAGAAWILGLLMKRK